MKPRHEVADIIHLFGHHLQRQYQLPLQVKKTLQALGICRTAALGGHLTQCKSCGIEKISYNSCRNRHCPKCQVINKERWIIARESELLPVGYYHLVFTLPAAFNALLPKHAKAVYGALFTASWQTVKCLAKDPKYLGAKPAMISILHTWGQQLWLHPHVHCIVPGGGITPAGKWKNATHKDKYLFPKKALSLMFRAKYMAALRAKIKVPQAIAKQAFKHQWVVYAKRPFATPKTVVEYLGRYTHKIAISNHRLLEVNQKQVSFTYKDYRCAGAKKVAKLNGVEFLRRFAMHILPKGFVRIRHYGFLASKNKTKELNSAKADLAQPRWENVKRSWQEIALEKLGINPALCPHCKKQTRVITKILAPLRGPPKPSLNHA